MVEASPRPWTAVGGTLLAARGHRRGPGAAGCRGRGGPPALPPGAGVVYVRLRMPLRSLTAASAASLSAAGPVSVPSCPEKVTSTPVMPAARSWFSAAVVRSSSIFGMANSTAITNEDEERKDPQDQAASLEDVHASPPAYESAARACAHQSSRSGSWLTIMSNIGWKLNQPPIGNSYCSLPRLDHYVLLMSTSMTSTPSTPRKCGVQEALCAVGTRTRYNRAPCPRMNCHFANTSVLSGAAGCVPICTFS